MIKILCFGITQDIIGKNQWDYPLEQPIRVQNFLESLQSAYPALVQLRSLGIAVNAEYVSVNDWIRPSDEVALIPPVSGG